jgi:DNA-binding IscR family transcriptional regulator
MSLWDEARQALERVYDTKSLKDLVDREQAILADQAPQYCI